MSEKSGVDSRGTIHPVASFDGLVAPQRRAIRAALSCAATTTPISLLPMNRRIALLIALTLAAQAPIRAQQGAELILGPLSDSVVHLPGGDSVQVQASGPAIVPNQPQGLLITYHPYFALADTARVRVVAVALFQYLLPKMTGAPKFVVLRAVNVSAAERNKGGYYQMNAYGIVMAYHDDGRWYDLHGTSPAF